MGPSSNLQDAVVATECGANSNGGFCMAKKKIAKKAAKGLKKPTWAPEAGTKKTPSAKSTASKKSHSLKKNDQKWSAWQLQRLQELLPLLPEKDLAEFCGFNSPTVNNTNLRDSAQRLTMLMSDEEVARWLRWAVEHKIQAKHVDEQK
jgi:hypothetical protein